MKHLTVCVISLVVGLLLASTAFAQVSGTKKVPGDYPTLTAAIADLNAKGVGEGGIVISIVGEGAILAATPIEAYAIKARATDARPIVIEGNGATIVLPSGKPLTTFFQTKRSGNITISGFNVVSQDGEQAPAFQRDLVQPEN